MANAENLQTMTSISSLPRELVSEVLALVAASSSTDLFRAKLCCKVLSEVSEENYIYQRVSLNKFAIVPWRKNHKVSMFLKKCRRSKNPEALYRKGVVDYFRGKNLESALECLKEAAKSGHDEAAYALGIIFLFGGDELKRKGMTLLSAMKKSRIQKRRMKDCRDNLRRILKMIWVKNPLVLSQRPICCAMQHKRKRGWLVDEIDEEESTCEGCTCDEEIAPICDALPQFLV
ncbi:putative F-box protein At1g67623 [Coffea arabica]|uniref:F-box protein At1g67623 n=1 Tax=Coffea arabica TaxID=13443 RepID=A0A6P6U4J6_COFAR|nr:putative F-box protein At1g67623 [Coffea arabica]